VGRIAPRYPERERRTYYSALIAALVLAMAGTAVTVYGADRLADTPVVRTAVLETLTIPEPFGSQVSASLEQRRPALLYIWIEGCSTCKAVTPVYQALKSEYAASATFMDFEYSAYPTVVEKIGATGAPSVYVVDRQNADGSFAALSLTGPIDRRSMKGALDRAIASMR
jgi:thiol-disulfide isomerase/thioredoxin